MELFDNTSEAGYMASCEDRTDHNQGLREEALSIKIANQRKEIRQLQAEKAKHETHLINQMQEYKTKYNNSLCENAELRQKYEAAVEDMNHIVRAISHCREILSGGTDRVSSLHLGRCDVCKKTCHEDKPCRFEWRGEGGTK